MAAKKSHIEVIINCRSRSSIRAELLNSLKAQTRKHSLKIIESASAPKRLCQIKNENCLYVFLDEDVQLPNAEYLARVELEFKKNQSILFLGGRYLSRADQPYLAKCYNSLIGNWLQIFDSTEAPTKVSNLPGGSWIASGKLVKILKDWQEPTFWAGEDTFALRWLQSRNVDLHYHPCADLFHFPRAEFYHFCRRAFLQGKVRKKLNLKTESRKLDRKLFFNNLSHSPGWALHQCFVELGSLSETKSRAAK